MRDSSSGTRSPSVERTVMLVDAVVAIAMTLLVLPLVDAAPDVDLDAVGAFVGDHLSLLISFVVSFLVILLFWSAHVRLFAFVVDMTTSLALLNAAWLLGIAFVPFPTALIGRGPTTSTAPVYIGTILFLGVVSAIMTALVARDATDEAVRTFLRARAVVAWVSAGMLLVCTLVSTVLPDLGLYCLALILPVRLAGKRLSPQPPG